MMTREELRQRMIDLFVEAKAVPQGYDIDWWTEKKRDDAAERWKDKPSWQHSFEEVVIESVDYFLREYPNAED
jgi:hypothetical protein